MPTTGDEANPVKRFLQSRNVGLCVCRNRMLGFRVVRSTMSAQFLWPQFTVDAKTRTERSPDHLNNKKYPDAQYYLNEVQQYMFRNEQLRHLRPAQFFRYFYHHTDGSTSKPKKVPTGENTLDEADEGAIEDDACHRNYDLIEQSCWLWRDGGLCHRFACSGSERQAATQSGFVCCPLIVSGAVCERQRCIL